MENQVQKESTRKRVELPSHEFLSQLVLNDPDAYEVLRQKLIADYMDWAPERHKSRLRGIQFRVDGLRRLSQSPLGSTIRVYNLMWENFLKLNYRWHDFIDTNSKCIDKGGATHITEHPSAESAQIIKFRHRAKLDQK